MYTLPMCIMVFKIFTPNFSPPIDTLAVIPLMRDNRPEFPYAVPIHKNVNPKKHSREIYLRVQKNSIVEEFESLLQLNNYEILDDTDPRMISWCQIGSNSGENTNYLKFPKDLKMQDGETIRADLGLDLFIQKHQIKSFDIAKEIVQTPKVRLCFAKIGKSIDEPKKWLELQKRYCDTDSVLALIEVNLLGAKGTYSSMAASLAKVQIPLDFNAPVNLKNYVDFGGFISANGFTRLIGYQGQLRLLRSLGVNDNEFDLRNKFGASYKVEEWISELIDMYHEDKFLVNYVPPKNDIIKLGSPRNLWKYDKSSDLV